MYSNMDLEASLIALGLQEYGQTLAIHGFHCWQQITNITEEDMAGMGFKLGHRRRLQRAVACFDGRPRWEPLSDKRRLSQFRAPTPFLVQNDKTTPSTIPKRRYERHSPGDHKTPRFPMSGYFLFFNFLRRNPQVSSLPSAQISQLASEQWHRLYAKERTVWISLAKKHKRPVEGGLVQYKQIGTLDENQTRAVLFDKIDYVCRKEVQIPATKVLGQISMTASKGMASESDAYTSVSLALQLSRK